MQLQVTNIIPLLQRCKFWEWIYWKYNAAWRNPGLPLQIEIIEIVQLVTTMLQLQQQKQAATMPQQVQQLEQRIAYTDDKINEKVYGLYGLSAAEVAVIENKN